jgi:hypothetical protein
MFLSSSSSKHGKRQLNEMFSTAARQLAACTTGDTSKAILPQLNAGTARSAACLEKH